jgi:glycosyltransferase involved in cell wall biosynthesis
MKISLIIPVYNESDNVFKLSDEVTKVLSKTQIEWECIWVDDGSDDNTWQKIETLSEPHKGLKLRTNCGQATATMAGIEISKYEYLITLDGDGQNDPNDILSMVQCIKANPDLDLVQGYREKREDHKYKKIIPSRIANIIVRSISGYKVLDLGCSLRLFKKSLVKNFRLTGEMHRLFTLYLLDNGASMIQIAVTHRPRTAGVTKYGFGRVQKLLTDIVLYKALKVIFISPIYTFAKFAITGYLFSFTLLLLAIILKAIGEKNFIDGNLVSTSIVLFSTSTIFIGLGLIAEMITRILSQNSMSYHYTIVSKHN